MTYSIHKGAKKIIHNLKDHGFQAYIAGGAVRDLLMEIEPKDFDIVTDAPVEVTESLFERTIPVGKSFGVVIVIMDGEEFEVAQFRSDGRYEDGRRPKNITFANPKKDALRRDFTINGLFMDVDTGAVIDFVEGQEDITNGVIRAIGNPVERFEEDRLRMLRAVRFASRFGFSIHAETEQAIRSMAYKIHSVSMERITSELSSILTEGGKAGLDMLIDFGLMGEILPEVMEMKDIPQPPEFHPEGDVLNHTLLLFEKVHKPSKTLAFAMLLHDIAKPITMTVRGRIRFNGHAKVGADMVRDITHRLRMSRSDRDRISHLVENHMVFHNITDMRVKTLKRLMQKDFFSELLELHRIDSLSSNGDLSKYHFAKEKFEEFQKGPPQPIKLLTGRDLIEMGYIPGPAFSTILTAVEDMQLENEISTKAQAIAFVREKYFQLK